MRMLLPIVCLAACASSGPRSATVPRAAQVAPAPPAHDQTSSADKGSSLLWLPASMGVGAAVGAGLGLFLSMKAHHTAKQGLGYGAAVGAVVGAGLWVAGTIASAIEH